MKNDEQAIRELVDKWLAASEAKDTAAVVKLMADDVIFMVPGREPFGKEAFAQNAGSMKDVALKTKSDIQEIHVEGNWAWMRNHLTVTMTPPGGKPTRHSGYILTILNKKPDGNWVISRDANLLTPEQL